MTTSVLNNHFQRGHNLGSMKYAAHEVGNVHKTTCETGLKKTLQYCLLQNYMPEKMFQYFGFVCFIQLLGFDCQAYDSKASKMLLHGKKWTKTL